MRIEILLDVGLLKTLGKFCPCLMENLWGAAIPWSVHSLVLHLLSLAMVSSMQNPPYLSCRVQHLQLPVVSNQCCQALTNLLNISNGSNLFFPLVSQNFCLSK